MYAWGFSISKLRRILDQRVRDGVLRRQRRSMPWDRFRRLLQRYPLPPAVAIHSAFRQAARP